MCSVYSRDQLIYTRVGASTAAAGFDTKNGERDREKERASSAQGQGGSRSMERERET
jgi:hypothetical protein